MDYRDQVSVFGNRVNRSLTDSKFIAWLIKVLKLEGFGTAKTTTLNPGYGIGITLLSETDTEKTYKVKTKEVVANTANISFVEDSFEYGQVVAAEELDITIELERNTYAMHEVEFSGVDAANLDLTGDAINDNLAVPDTYEVVTTNTSELINGDTAVGTVILNDSEDKQVVVSIAVTRQNRYIYGLCQTEMSAADIATALASVAGDIAAEDEDANFLWLTTALGTLPDSFDINTFGENRTFFIASMDSALHFKLVTGLPYNLPSSTHTINLNTISSGVSNTSRLYYVYTESFNANFNLYLD